MGNKIEWIGWGEIMEALQVRQRSSDFDRISNELSLLEWRSDITERSLVAGGRMFGGSGVQGEGY